MRRLIVWSLAGIVGAALTVMVFLPANWMVALVELQTGGRLTLGDAQGTLWRGSAFIGGAPDGNDPLTPLLPGRFSWRLSPLLLLGHVDAELENAAALSQPVSVTGSWHQWQLSPATVLLPAERLAALGAPLNSIQPSGQMRLSWETMQFVRQGGAVDASGTMNLELKDMASRLSPVKPLGTYNISLDWRGQQASVMLKTAKGPMLLSGSGVFANGHLQFSGEAEVEAGHEERLANLVNLLGQRRMEGGRNIIALEFK